MKCSKTSVRYWLKNYELRTHRGPHGKYPKNYQIPRKCACGETDPTKFYGHKKTICGECQNKYNLEQGQKKKAYMRKKLGGKCLECGYKKYQCSLDIHHLDPKQKDVSFASSRGWSYKKIDQELEKCILLCKNCHMVYHCGELELTFGE